MHRNPIIAPMYEKGGPSNIAFTLSLGYKDPRGVTAKYHNHMKVNEYVKLVKKKKQLKVAYNKIDVDEYVSWANNDRE